MVIVETLALSTMVMNSIIMPILINFHDAPKFPAVVLNIKRLVILAVVYLGYLFAISVGEFDSLVDIGLKSFEAVSLFAPAFFLGLYWKRGNRQGATAGLLGGFAVWFYTLIIPALIKAGIVRDVGIVGLMTHSEMLNPHALFGIEGLGKWGNAFFWSMLMNLVVYIGVSVLTRQSKEEEIQALIFVESYERVKELAHGSSYTADDLENILAQYIGRAEAANVIKNYLLKKNMKREELTPKALFELRDEAEKVLSGAIGSSMAAIIFKDKLVLTEKERGELSESIQHITESLRLSRQELAETNREISFLKEFNENIIESAPVGILTIDSFLKVKYWNREMETITGIKRAGAVNGSIISLLPWLTRETLLQNKQREMTVQNPSLQSFKINVSQLKDPSGGFVVILEDITGKKKLEEQLLQTSKLASIGKLTAGISHEIGNPLASISSLVQELSLLEMDTEHDISFTMESLKTMNSHLDRIARIVRSLGDFARMSSAKRTVSNISEILDRSVNLVKYDKRFKNVQFTADISEVPCVRLNPDQIQQVFLNLMLNALDAMPDGGNLCVSMKKVGAFVEVVFSDTGVGIDEAVRDRIFDPFFTTKAPGRGTGLGLSICYGIIREHNGNITVKSEKGVGTTFVVSLSIEKS
jgi:PAS domain S-box-containing protein